MVILAPNRKKHIEWHLDNFYISKDNPFSFEDYPFLLDIYMDEFPDISILKSAQAGLSVFAISRGLYVCDALQGTCMYLFPNANHIGDFVQHRIDPTIKDSPRLNSLRLKSLGHQSGNKFKKSADKVRLKKINNGFMYFRGTQSLMEVTSTPADMIVVDEYDQAIQKNIPPAIERLSNSNLKWVLKLSTPELPEGPTELAYKQSDARKWMVRCDHCGTHQDLDWERNFIKEHKGLDQLESTFLPYLPRDERISEELSEQLISDNWRHVIDNMKFDISAVCFKCGRNFDRLSKGEWVPEFQKRSSHGYHVHRLMSPRHLIANLYSNFIRSQHDVAKLSTFYKQSLGIGFDPSGTSLTENILKFLQENINVDNLKYDFISCGVDVGSVFHIQISKNLNGKRFPWIKKTLKDKDDVKELLRMYNVNICIVDVEPELRISEELRDYNREMVFLCKFGLQADAKEITDKDWFQPNYAINRVMCDRTIAFDQATHDILNKKCLVNSSWIADNTWVSQMCNPKRVLTETSTGKKRHVWQRTSADHYRLADVYDCLAVKLYETRNNFSGERIAITKDIDYSEQYQSREYEDRNMDTDDNKILKKIGAFNKDRYPNDYLEIIENG